MSDPKCCALRRHRPALATILGVVALGSAAWLFGPGSSSAADGPVIIEPAAVLQLGELPLGELRGRTHSIVVEPSSSNATSAHGSTEPTYAVYNGFGQLLASGLTADQLASFRPELDPNALDAGSTPKLPLGEPLMLAEELHTDY